MSAQTVSVCVVCGAQTDRFLCGDERSLSGCLGKLLRDLGNCAALVQELDTTIARVDKLGTASVGYVSNGGDEIPLPLNMNAVEAKLLLRDRLVSWCRDLWERNSARDENGAIPPLDLRPGVLAASRWLMRHPTWIALHPAVDDLYDEIRETIRQAWRAVDTAPDKVYIGTCSTVVEQWWDDEDQRPEGPAPVCAEELYARDGDWEKRCPVCATIHDVEERQEVLASAVEHQYVPAGTLVGVVGGRGERLTEQMLRSLRRRGKVTAYVRLADDETGDADRWGFRVRPWVEGDPPSARLYLVGQVLDVITNKWARQAA